jgi:hypothetical protein
MSVPPAFKTVDDVIRDIEMISKLFTSFLKKKAVLLHATDSLEGREGIAPTHSSPWYLMGVSGQRHSPAAL